MSTVTQVWSMLKSRGGALAVVAALQLGALGTMVADRVRIVKTGREIVLPIVPVDPRDLFKGDYVRLGYPISTIPATARKDGALDGAKEAYVTIEQGADQTWSVVQIDKTYPKATAVNQVVLHARPAWGWRNDFRNVRYGIERYYVPEGKGRDLEKLAREKKLAAIVAVDTRGNAVITGLSSEGKRVYDEPLL
jgi:uncharacterized membrane-anchored protein